MSILQGLRSVSQTQWPNRMPAVPGFGFSMPTFGGDTRAPTGFEQTIPLKPSDGENAVVLLPAPLQTLEGSGRPPAVRNGPAPVPNYPPAVNPPSPRDPGVLARIRDRMQATRSNMGKGARKVRDNFVDPFARYPQLVPSFPGSAAEIERYAAQDFLPNTRPRYV